MSKRLVRMNPRVSVAAHAGNPSPAKQGVPASMAAAGEQARVWAHDLAVGKGKTGQLLARDLIRPDYRGLL
jgi:hypothetical protein